jgi:hypothetical protein
MSEFEVVERPRGSGRVPSELIEELKKTLNTTKAVRLKLEPNAFVNWQATVRAQLRTTHNLRLRTKHNKATNIVTAWAENFDVRDTGAGPTDEELGVSADNAGVGPALAKP